MMSVCVMPHDSSSLRMWAGVIHFFIWITENKYKRQEIQMTHLQQMRIFLKHHEYKHVIYLYMHVYVL